MSRPSGAALTMRWLGVVGLCLVALEAFFALRIATLRWIDVESTSFQRSEFWRVVILEGRLDAWHQQWRPTARIADNLKRAVIASEDASFSDHGGFEWDAIEKAWERNERARLRAEQASAVAPARAKPPRIVGGSTISQQLAKNLFLSGERTALRKGQEILVTFMLEALLDKSRILEIYLNSVEWGDGVFGAQAAAQRYFRTDADRLGALQAARLAVMLPAPKRFEKQPGSAYVTGRAATIAARMSAVELP